MRIQHNIAAMNSYRNYGNNVKAVNKNLEKLSSGYKVNRAGDDAAGLAISEKMRAQITGLDAAQKNVKDGISLVKTAEGAMQEIQDMLNRMDYLATQSANGTYDESVDRVNLQKEVNSLMTEIDRIADSANFNGIKLLEGTQNGMATAAFSQATSTTTAQLTLTLGNSKNSDVTKLIGGTIQIGNKTWTVKAGAATSSDVTISSGAIVIGGKVGSGSWTKVASAVKASLAQVKFKTMNGSDIAVSVTNSGAALTFKVADGTGVKIDASSLLTYSVNNGLRLQVGDTAHNYNQMRVGISDMHCDTLFLSTHKPDISTQDGAADAIGYIRNAINQVSSTRGDLGAIQNRLEHTANNLSVMTENIQDAESTIRDTDVAEEMMSYTKNNILIQSAQAMLAQSNQIPQGVLQLLG